MSAVFEADEETLGLEIEMKSTGTAQIRGVAKSLGETRSALHFSFASDQSLLRRTLKQLEKLSEQFPTRGQG